MFSYPAIEAELRGDANWGATYDLALIFLRLRLSLLTLFLRHLALILNGARECWLASWFAVLKVGKLPRCGEVELPSYPAARSSEVKSINSLRAPRAR